MKTQTLTRFDKLELQAPRAGLPQTSGALTLVPLFGRDRDGYVAPLSGLKLSKVEGYGNLELKNDGRGVAIVPLHIGYIQDQAQNHAMCRAALLGAGQKAMFEDACCVQAAQGGFLEGKDQWFFVLPVELRERALALRGTQSFDKLWGDIAALNKRYGVRNRGHLDELIVAQRPYLTQLQSRFEAQPGQTGALLFLGEELIGLELAPSAAYYAELHAAVVCFAYGPLALTRERVRAAARDELDDDGLAQHRLPALEGDDLEAIEAHLVAERQVRSQRLWGALEALPAQGFELREEERFLDHQLATVEGSDFAGQVVREGDELVYASLFSRAERLHALELPN
jgi:hypothetical protein